MDWTRDPPSPPGPRVHIGSRPDDQRIISYSNSLTIEGNTIEMKRKDILPSFGAPTGGGGLGMAGSGGPRATGDGGGVGGSSGAGIQTRVPSGWPQTCHLRGISRGRRGEGSRRGDGGGDAEDGTGEEGEFFEIGSGGGEKSGRENGRAAREAFHPNEILPRFFPSVGPTELRWACCSGPLEWGKTGRAGARQATSFF
jgi:hypothetical protein